MVVLLCQIVLVGVPNVRPAPVQSNGGQFIQLGRPVPNNSANSNMGVVNPGQMIYNVGNNNGG